LPWNNDRKPNKRNNQSSYQSRNQSSNQSRNQSADQSIDQSSTHNSNQRNAFGRVQRNTPGRDQGSTTGRDQRSAPGRDYRSPSGRDQRNSFGRDQSSYQSRNQNSNQSRSQSIDQSNNQRSTQGRDQNSTSNRPRFMDRNYSHKDNQVLPKITEVNEPVEEDIDKLEGRNSVIEALKAGRPFNKILISKGDREGSIKLITAMAKEKGIIVQEVDRLKLDSISTTYAHQGVIAYVAPRDYVELDDILKIAEEKGEQPFLIILDEITDPHNLGSIMRTADTVGVHGIIIPKRRSVGLTTAVSKASAGAIEYVPVARVTNIAQTIDVLKKKGIWVIGTDTTGEKSFFESDLKGPIALVIGSEGEGMGKLISEKCDFVVNIPMKGKISSLNAAVAAGVLMFEILKQRGI